MRFLFLIALVMLTGCASIVQSQPLPEPLPIEVAIPILWIEPEPEPELVVGCSLGNKAPDFCLDSALGEVNLSDYEGEMLLLNFWRISCPPCRFELPYFQKAYEKGLRILAVNIGDHPNTITKFMHMHSFTFPVLICERGTLKDYAVQYVPQNFLLDEEGIIQYVKLGNFQDGEIAQIIK